MRRRRAVHPHRFLALFAAVLIVFQTGALASAASTTTTSPSTSSIKPDYKFFVGKTITIVINGALTSQTALVAAAVVPGWEHYLHATINIDSIPTAPDAVEEDSVLQTTPDGLTLGVQGISGPLNAVYTNSGLPNVPMAKANWIGGVGSAPQVVVACGQPPTPAIPSFAQLAQGGIQANVIALAPSSSTELIHILMDAYPIPHKYITGYTSSAQPAGCERGDGNITNNQAAKFTNAAETGFATGATPILLSGPEPKGSQLAFINSEVPTLATFVKQHPPKTPFGKEGIKLAEELFATSAPNQSFFTTPGVSKARLAALSDALHSAMKLGTTKRALLFIGSPTPFMSSELVTATYAAGLKHEPIIQRFLNN